MKTNAIIRIIIYSLVIILLVGLLLTCLGVGSFMFNVQTGGSEVNEGTGSVKAENIDDLQIDWAAGSVTIVTDNNTDAITFTETGDFSEKYAMVYTLKNGTLSLEYAKPSLAIGFISTPTKELVITVPSGWVCNELEIDGAALEVNISGIHISKLQLDGAAMKLNLEGSVQELDVDGAACKLNISCSGYPDLIEIDGASCELNLTIPENCGMLIQTDGIACDVDSNLELTHRNDGYLHGDGRCKVDVDGIACQLNIQFEPQELLPTIPYSDEGC